MFGKKRTEPKLFCTLLASFPHFNQFAHEDRLAGIRLNSATVKKFELNDELRLMEQANTEVPLWFDIKGRQPRVAGVMAQDGNMVLTLNHPIEVATPLPVLFKAGGDNAELVRVECQGHKLVFNGGPYYEVNAGESLHLRHPSFRVIGPSIFTDEEKEKIEMVRKAGLTRWFLSYVEEERDLDEFQELVGRDVQVMLKIETVRGLEFAQRFKKRKRPNMTLVAACGDLYVEVDRPHQILTALRMLIKRDPEAMAGSRMLLSVCREEVPSLADFCHLSWLYDLGYRTFLLCDELCLKGDLLDRAVNAFDGFKETIGFPAK